MHLLLIPLLLAYSTAESNIVRVIGGKDANIAQHPWQVSLFLPDDTFTCAGTIITPNWILTAAHCNLQQNYTTIRAGSNGTDKGGQVVEVIEIIKHDGFNVSAVVHDIALAKLATPLSGVDIAPVTLPRQSEPLLDGTMVNVAGWGLINETILNKEDVFKEVEVPVVNVDECNVLYEDHWKNVTEFQFCAGNTEGGEGPCYGDSGGPAVVDGVAVGIVSWSKGCAHEERPAVYTKISEYVEWIRGVIDGDGDDGL